MVVLGFVPPVCIPYIITQTYQEHLDYAAAHPEITYNGGIDLYSTDRTIRAAFPGKIDKIAYQANGYGNYIKIRHDWGYSVYAHLERIYKNVGDSTEAGDDIGLMGSTGFSTGTHLHFEIRDLSEKTQDPTDLFESQPTNIESCSSLTTIAAPSGGNLRKTPLGDYITTIPAGTVGRILDGPVYRGGLPVYQVEFPISGWMAERDSYGTKILQSMGEK